MTCTTMTTTTTTMTTTITITDDPHAPRKDHDAGPAGAYEVLEEAVRTLLIEKGVLTPQEIAASVDLMDSRSPALGAKVVARAWADPAFKKLLLKDTRAALMQMGIDIGARAGVQHGREHAGGAQRHRLHAVLLLSQDAARHSAGLVQEPGLPLAHGRRSARRAGRVRRRGAEGRGGARARFHRRPALHRAAHAAQGHQGLERGRSLPPSSRATA